MLLPTTTDIKPSSQQGKKTPTLQERRFLIKRGEVPLLITTISLYDQINTTLGSTLIQHMESDILNITLIIINTVKATALNSRGSTFFHFPPLDPWYLFYPHGH